MNNDKPGRLRVVIIHGAYGRPDSNWFPWLAERVQAAGHEALMPRFPTPQDQSPEAWLEAYDRQVDAAVPRARTVLVGHSLGVAFVLRLVARAGAAAGPYRGALLAAGFWGALGLPDYDPINAPFFVPLDWNAARAGCGSGICYASDDDPYVPLRFSREIAERLGAPLRIIPGGKHLNAENGMTAFPELAGDLEALLAAPGADYPGSL